jgi:hypothetical protein
MSYGRGADALGAQMRSSAFFLAAQKVLPQRGVPFAHHSGDVIGRVHDQHRAPLAAP